MRNWPIEGRAAELALIRRMFAGRSRNALLVRGAAGVGKTRLVRESLAGLGGRTEWIAATRAAATIPFGALAPLLPPDAPLTAGAVGLMRAIRDHVASWGGRHQVTLAVDDAHLLDDASSIVVADLVTRGTAFVLLTVRQGEPLADSLARLARDADADVLELGGLPDDVIDLLIDHSTSGDVAAVRRHRLRTAARGNPLALRELLHGAVPGGLTALVESRLDRLAAPTRAVVEMVACAEPVPLAFLEKLATPDAIADAEESGLVTARQAGARVQTHLEHPLFGEVLRARMPVARARRVYRDLADVLMATPMRRRDDLLRAALWQVEGGRVVRPDLVHDGARLAIGRSGLLLAERLARAARDAEPSAEADWLLAEILEYAGRGAEAAALLPATPPVGTTGRIQWAIARATWLYWSRGQLTAAREVLDSVAGHPVVEGHRAFTLFFAGQLTEVVTIAHDVLTSGDPQGVIWAAAAATAAYGFLGRVDEAERVRQQGVAVATAHAAALPWAMFQLDVAACLGYLGAGQPDRAVAVATAAREAALSDGVPMMVSGWALYGGMAVAATGDVARAEPLLAEAVEGFTRTNSFRMRRICLAAHAWVRALAGDAATANDLMALADGQGETSNQVFDPWVDTWRAWVSRASGDTAAAASHAHRAADRAAEAGMPVVAVLARFDALRVGGTAGLASPPPSGPLGDTLTTAAQALAADDGDTLVRAAKTLHDLGHHLHAAELATAAFQALRRTGRRGSAALAAATAADLSRHCPGAVTPLLSRTDLDDLLTARERQIALLAAHLTTREIATQLDLAIPTVNNHLAHAYSKLGVHSRPELRALLGLPSPPP